MCVEKAAAMTAPAPWPLRDALDELLSREGWEKDVDAVVAMEFRIERETGIAIHLSRPYDLIYPIPTDPCDDERPVTPFLRSRDAAAMLEEAVWPIVAELGVPSLSIERQPTHYEIAWAQECHKTHVWLPVTDLPDLPAHIGEPAARTRAALEAGFRIGLWPFRGDLSPWTGGAI